MTEELGPVEGSTNGNHAVMEAEDSRGGAPALDGRSVDERLDLLLHTIRTWDWRKAVVEPGLLHSDAAATTAAPTMSAPTVEDRGDPASPAPDEGTPAAAFVDRATNAQLAERNSGPRHAAAESAPLVASEDALRDAASSIGPQSESLLDAGPPTGHQAWGTQVDADQHTVEAADSLAPLDTASTSSGPDEERDTLVLEQPDFSDPQTAAPGPTTHPAVSGPSRNTVVVPTDSLDPNTETIASPIDSVDTGLETTEMVLEESVSTKVPEDVVVDETAWFGHEPEPEPEPDRFLHRVWSHPTTKLVVFVAAAAVIVLLVIAGIRHFAAKPNSSGPSVTTVPVTHHAVSHSHVVAPISATLLAQYDTYAAALQNSNLATSNGLAKAGSSPTASQLVLVVVAYQSAVKSYSNDLGLIRWPASMQGTIESDHAQLQGLTSFLQSFSTVAPNSIPAWLVQLRERASSTEAVDNVVRKDLGMPPSTSFP